MPVDTYTDIEVKLKKIQQARAIEQALEHCKFGVSNKAMIYRIAAEDAGEAERSVILEFTESESKAIFEAVAALIAKRLAKIKTEL